MMTSFIATPEINSVVVLSDGFFLLGKGIGTTGKAEGEICFNTGLTGYQETLTDPSYANQIITFSFPHIGNVGTNFEDDEANVPYCKGLVIRESITQPSSFRAKAHLNHWLIQHKLVGISGVDTRELTQHIRKNGAKHTLIYHAVEGETVDIQALAHSIKKTPGLEGCELSQQVTTPQSYFWSEHTFTLGQTEFKKQQGHQYTVAALDFGIKHNILRLLVDEGFKVVVLPSTSTFDDIMAVNPDGVFLSNGPGDPFETAKFTTPVLQQLVEKKVPIFGICMGHQLLALSAGIPTVKMHKGHRGTNQPVQDLRTKRVFITSQNHGFCVTDDHIPAHIEITHKSLFDQTVEGLRFKNAPAFSVQFHPESSPGPHDTQFLFHEFKTMIAECKS